jgi:hypothetical protein
LLGQVATVVTPDTLLRWYRELVAKKYDGSQEHAKGRPVTKADIAQLVLRMAKENPTWGYTRLRGALDHLGHEVGRGTIQRILSDAGLEPAPERGKRGSWAAFLKAHAGQIAAMDFFSVEVVCCRRSGRGPLPPEAPRPGSELRATRNWSGGHALRQDHGQTKRKKTRVFCSKATGSSTGAV